MSNRSSLRFIAALLFAATACAALAFAESGIRAQNTNSSTTTDESAQNANANTNTTRRGRGRRGRRGAAANANAADSNANTGDATATGDNANTGADTGAGGGAAQEEETRDLSGQQEDLSGSYTGRVTMTGAHEMSGEATLTITGNQFTLTSEGMTHNGRVLAVNTRGYIGAAFYFADMTDPATKTPVVANVRARKSGERLTLTPVTPTSARLTFTPAGTGRRGRATSRGATPDANSNTGDNSNTTPPM